MMPEKDSSPRFTPYDVVRLIHHPNTTGVILDYDFRMRDELSSSPSTVYQLITCRGARIVAWEDEVEFVERMEPSLKTYEIVELRITDLERAEYSGLRGVVSGFAWDYRTDTWFFTVGLQDGTQYYIREEELVSIGRYLPEHVIKQIESRKGHWVPCDRSHYVLEHEETVTQNRRPEPYPVDLNTL